MSVQTEITRLIEAKAAIKNAIERKGVSVPDTTTLDGMAVYIDSIVAGDAPTLISFTLDGKTYQAEEGMTWAQWEKSAYNDKYVFYSEDGEYIGSSHTGYLFMDSKIGTEPEKFSDVIVNGGVYSIEFPI